MFTQFTFRILVILTIGLLFVSCSFSQTSKEETATPTVTPTTTSKPDESKSWATLGRLYVVIVTDDKLEGVSGQVALKNGEVIETLFKNNIAPGAFAVIKVPAEQITRQTIFSIISNLPIKSQDAICLYFSGKGKLDRKYGTFFELSKGKEELYRSELRSALAKKNCRLNVLISDFSDGKEIPVKPEPKPESQSQSETAENTEQKKPEETKKAPETAQTESAKPETAQTESAKPETAQTESAKPETAQTESAKPETAQTESAKPEVTTTGGKKTSPLFFSLFFQSTGVVDIISSNLNQQSLPSDKGIGCFTEAFSIILDTNKNKGLSWYRLFPYIARGTGLVFENIYVDGAVFNGLKQIVQSPIHLTLGQENYNPDIFSEVYPRGNDFDSLIPSVTDKEIALTDEDRKTITKLVLETFNVIRPQNDQEKGTHEDFTALDPDNTVNGLEGNPFSTTLPSLRSNRSESTETPPAATPPTEEKVKFGVRAANNNGDGVLITDIRKDYPGAKAGLEIGDVILTIDGKKITSEKEYSDAIDAAGQEMKLLIRNKRYGNTSTVLVPLTAP